MRQVGDLYPDPISFIFFVGSDVFHFRLGELSSFCQGATYSSDCQGGRMFVFALLMVSSGDANS